MSRKTETVVTVTATDDVTGFTYADDMAASLARYKITICRVNNDDTVIKGETPCTYFADMHDNTVSALCSLLSGSLLNMLGILLRSLIGHKEAATIAEYAGGLIGDDEMVIAFGGGKKPKSTSRASDDFIPYMRAYAIAKGWSNASGTKIGEKGKLSQDIALRFITETGITAEKYAAGERVKTDAPVTDQV